MAKYPKDLIVRPLEAGEWDLIEKTYVSEFGNGMPHNPAQSTFYGVFLGEQLVGFAHLEKLFHLNAVFLNEVHRNRNIVEGVFDILDSEIPDNFPAVIFPDKDVKKLLGKYGFVSLGNTDLWRKEY
ncbi:MAG: hypothetical protein ABL984_11945 [Pyrinomonadaceae bacterium]|nr:hypothetical protein [Acidobacteriota bacterium]